MSDYLKKISDLPLLSIAIPTFNRRSELSRLIAEISAQAAQHGLSRFLEIVICDNSDDFFSVSSTGDLNITYLKNNKNIGFDKNVEKSLRMSNGTYVWLFGDDDIPEDGALYSIINFILKTDVSVILLPFRQPENLSTLPYSSHNEFDCWTSLEEKVELVLKSGKLTNFVLKNSCAFAASGANGISEPSGWAHQLLALDTILSHPDLPIATGGRFFAGSKDCEYSFLRWTPYAYSTGGIVTAHPIFLTQNSKLNRIKREYLSRMFSSELTILARALSGVWAVENINEFKRYARFLHFRMDYLLSIRTVILFILIKTRQTAIIRLAFFTYDMLNRQLRKVVP